MASAAAERIVAAAGRPAQAARPFTLVLSGGSTPARLFRVLASDPYRGRLDWGRIHFFWGDERCVAPEHEESNYRMARDNLLGPLGIPKERVHRMAGEHPDPESAAREYEGEILDFFRAGPQGPPPAFDLVLLGLGADGHTASLFPGTRALEEDRRWVVANFVPKLGASRLTLTFPILNRAHRVVFMVAGAGKAQAVAEVLEGPHDPRRLPAQGVQPAEGEAFWLLDEAAAARLGPSATP